MKEGVLCRSSRARIKSLVVGLRSGLVAIAIAAATVAFAFNLRAAEDAQQICLGLHILYVPKIWMRDKLPGAGTVTVQKSPSIVIDRAQSGPIDASKLDIWPEVYWQPYGARDLPRVIEIIYDFKSWPIATC